ncbi:hypothetical protein CVT25_011856 [Psilocybe cyanescens]|uniref:FAD-binding domain-containing protein n=1 Tax=Psilocybe cyanescens TaxID=93625 RepID=A0A409WJ15_PSICY|nr:hypothetical protein CVT25_011856 [Psilocybe cyanescens]
MSKGPIRIAIIGAGIGGLTLSSALEHLEKDRNFEITIYEASAQISEIGAGINFWPRSWSIMKALGLEKSLLQILPRVPDDSPRVVFQVRKGDQAEGLHIQDLTMKGGGIRFHRAELQKVLLSHSRSKLHLSYRLVSYDEDGDEIHLQFENGNTAICDLLIGMDGIKSAVRRCFLLKRSMPNSPSMNPVCSGDIAYRGLISVQSLEKAFPGHRAISSPTMYCGKSKLIITYPVSKDTFVNFVSFDTDMSQEGASYEGPTTVPCTREEVASIFSRWEEEVQSLVRCIEKPTKWVIRFLRPMDRYSLGRVVLAGDAAHAMTPHLGSGAGRADAYILSSLISDKLCTRSTLPRIAEIFNEICCPAGKWLTERSSYSGKLCRLMAPGFEEVLEGDSTVPHERLVDIVKGFSKELEFVWKESAEEDRMRALKMLSNSDLITGGLRVAIIGAGIGGLSLSAALGFMGDRDDLEIDIYEASPCISDVGAGISTWPRTWEVAKAMGLHERLLSFLPCLPNDSPSCIFQIRKSDQAQGFCVRDIMRNGGAIRFHRADLQKVLKDSIGGRLHLSHSLVSYQDTGDEVLLYFANGTTATCDLLIGFDGINSIVRKGLLSSQGLLDSPSLHPIWSGTTAYRALVPMEKLKAALPGHSALTAPMLYSGKSKHIVTYPISQDKILNIVAYDTDVSRIGTIYDGPTALSCTPEEVLSVYEGWEEEVQVIIQSIESATKWILRDLVPLDRYALGRVALAGDATHAMTPHQGAGAGQAIEDAFILASLISDPLCTKQMISKVSQIYDTVSRPRGNRAMRLSRLTGELSELIAPGLEGDAQASSDILERAFQAYEDGLHWVYEDLPHEGRKQALEMLHSSETV